MSPSAVPRPSRAGRQPLQLERLARAPSLYHELCCCSDVGQMLARVAELARTACGFERTVVAAVQDGTLTSEPSDALADPASDRLRRRLANEPLELHFGSYEADLVRGAPDSRRPSALAVRLELETPLLVPLRPDGRVIAVVVMDRPEAGAIEVLDRAVVDTFTVIAGVALERLLQRLRLEELSMNARSMGASLMALLRDAADPPPVLPRARGGSYAFPRDRPGLGDGQDLLTPREHEVAALLVKGRSNPQIAAELMLGTETVKDHVAGIRRKLRAANRVEAASRYVEMTGRREV